MRPILLALAFFAVIFFASRAAADAALRVCNGTDTPVTVAIAVLESGATGIQSESEGWFHIDSQTCARVIETDLNPAARYYLYAKSETILWTGDAKGGTTDAAFCTNFSGRFFYFNRAGAQCSGAGEQMLWFINEPIKRLDWTVNLYSS